jgi:predicted esterase
MQQQEIEFNFKARYHKLGDVSTNTKQIWFVLHGYGQLAQYFLRKFAVLEQHNICVIAPEGLSRFYLENFEAGKGRKSNRVGASWMTRENREMDIQNYISYLNSVHQKEIGSVNIPITIVGFSQGSATASRWALQENLRYNRLILWAGVFPPDMNFETGKHVLQKKEVLMVYGKQDPFLTDDRFTEMKVITDKLGAHIGIVAFNGDHDIDQETLLKLI